MQVQVEKPRKEQQLKIGIVGPEELKWTEEKKAEAKMKINQLLNSLDCDINPEDKNFMYKGIVLVSGHCPKGGVDIWAEEIADKLRIQKEIYFAPAMRWEDKFVEGIYPDIPSEFLKGYRSRNIQIAKASDVVYCIVPKVKLPVGFDITKPETMSKKFACYHCHKVGHPTNGGCWTMIWAKKLGKETHLVVIE